MTKTTHCNNDFQAELMKMLRNMGVSTNSTLTLSNENNGMVVITSRNFNNSTASQTAPVTNYIFRNRYDGENPNFVSLTDDQVRLLKYLEDYCCLNSDWDFDEINSCTFEKI